jgi:hypothetical protein
LNTQFKTDKFSVMFFTHGTKVYPDQWSSFQLEEWSPKRSWL